MFSSNKPLHSFDRPQKSFGFVGVNCVLNILLMRDNFQVIKSIVGTIKVLVVYFQTALNASVKRFPHNAMDSAAGVNTVSTQRNLKIPLKQFYFARSVSGVADPSFTQLDRMGCGYAGAQKLSNLFKGSAVFKHLLGLGNFGSVKGFTSGDAAHISNVAHFVQIFKIQNWFPRFHSHTPFNMNGSIA